MRKDPATRTVLPPTVILAVLTAILVLISNPAFGQEFYGCDNQGRLFIVDVGTGIGTHICNLPTYPDPGATELEYDDQAYRGFVQARDGIFSGQLVDMLTCAPLGGMVGTDDFAFNGLEYVDGVLYGTGIAFSCEPSHFMILDPETGATTLIGMTGKGPISGLAWDAVTQTMYGITGCWKDYGLSELVTIDLLTGLATTVGNTGISAGSLEFGPDDMLYAGGNNTDGGNLYQINTADGTATLVGPTGFPGVTGLTLVSSRAITAQLDIKPGSCPNSLNVRLFEDSSDDGKLKKGGVLPVAILGTDEFDVHDIDPSTILFQGVAPLRDSYEDVAAPVVDGYECECTTSGPDGFVDLSLKFSTRDIVAMLGNGCPGCITPLTMTGQLMDGTPFEATDCVRIIGWELDPPPPPPLMTGGPKTTLGPAVPNPFNPETRISYVLAQPGFVRLGVYDVTGRLVTRLVSEDQSAGEYVVEWKAGELPSGVYFCRFETGDVRLTRKMLLLR